MEQPQKKLSQKEWEARNKAIIEQMEKDGEMPTFEEVYALMDEVINKRGQ